MDFKIKTLKTKFNKIVKLQIWDSAGQERFKAITSCYYRGTHGIILCFDITDKKSFENVKMWLNEIHTHTDNKNIQIICVGTKSDLPHERQVDKSEVITFVDTNNFLYLETSSKNITNVDKMFNLIVENIISTQTNNVIPTPPPYKQKVLF